LESIVVVIIIGRTWRIHVLVLVKVLRNSAITELIVGQGLSGTGGEQCVDGISTTPSLAAATSTVTPHP